MAAIAFIAGITGQDGHRRQRLETSGATVLFAFTVQVELEDRLPCTIEWLEENSEARGT